MIASESLVLGEAAVLETLRRDPRITLHPTLEHGLLVYDDAGRNALTEVHNRYIRTARDAGLPIVISTPTWRMNPERLVSSGLTCSVAHRDAVSFMNDIRFVHESFSDKIWIAGLMGCRGDAYQPDQALSVTEAHRFHSKQASELAEAGPDLLVAVTLPAVTEAEGIARAMQDTGVPFVISFVISSEGCLLDGHTLEEAIERIDSVASPMFYGINCAHPDFYDYRAVPSEIRDRIQWFEGNGAACDHHDLDGSDELRVDDENHWARRSAELHREAGIKVVGGCCGTSEHHLELFLREIRGENNR